MQPRGSDSRGAFFSLPKDGASALHGPPSFSSPESDFDYAVTLGFRYAISWRTTLYSVFL